MKRSDLVQLGAQILVAVGLVLSSAAASSHYRIARVFQIGGPGAWDYTTVDPVNHHLYVSHGATVAAIDLASGKTIGTISPTLGARGIVVVPELGRGYIACAKANSVLVFDLKTLAPIAQVKTDEKPDALTYDPTAQFILAFTHNKSATVFDAKTGFVKGSIGLGGGPEFAVADGQGKVYASLQDTNQVVQLDPRQLHLDQRWPVTSCEAATSLGIDKVSRRLFVGCHNRTVVVMDANNGRVVEKLPIGPGVDGTVFDPDTQLAFVSSGGDGTATVIHENDPDHFSIVDVVKTRHSARTIALDSITHRIYLPFAKTVGTPVSNGEEEQFEDGTFAVLELSR
jgi:DNA-binding beta-propeller fold protein YncE